MSRLYLCPRCGEDLPYYLSKCPTCAEENAKLHKYKKHNCDVCGRKGRDLGKKSSVGRRYLCYDCFHSKTASISSGGANPSGVGKEIPLDEDVTYLTERLGSQEAAIRFVEGSKEIKLRDYIKNRESWYGNDESGDW